VEHLGHTFAVSVAKSSPYHFAANSLHLKGLGPEILAYQLSCYGPLIRTHIISGEKDQRHYRIQVTNSSTDTASKVGRTAKQPFQRPGRKMLPPAMLNKISSKRRNVVYELGTAYYLNRFQCQASRKRRSLRHFQYCYLQGMDIHSHEGSKGLGSQCTP
jgi:hypothetical protein